MTWSDNHSDIFDVLIYVALLLALLIWSAIKVESLRSRSIRRAALPPLLTSAFLFAIPLALKANYKYDGNDNGLSITILTALLFPLAFWLLVVAIVRWNAKGT